MSNRFGWKESLSFRNGTDGSMEPIFRSIKVDERVQTETKL